LAGGSRSRRNAPENDWITGMGGATANPKEQAPGNGGLVFAAHNFHGVHSGSPLGA
jgi:hypothetical protein